MKTRSISLRTLCLAMPGLCFFAVILLLFKGKFLLPIRKQKLLIVQQSLNSVLAKYELTSSSVYSDAEEKLAGLSTIVQAQLAQLQSDNTLCGGPTLLCGNSVDGECVVAR